MPARRTGCTEAMGTGKSNFEGERQPKLAGYRRVG